MEKSGWKKWKVIGESLEEYTWRISTKIISTVDRLDQIPRRLDSIKHVLLQLNRGQQDFSDCWGWKRKTKGKKRGFDASPNEGIIGRRDDEETTSAIYSIITLEQPHT